MWGNSVWGFFSLSVAFALAGLAMIWTPGHEEWGPRLIWASIICFAIGVIVLLWPLLRRSSIYILLKKRRRWRKLDKLKGEAYEEALEQLTKDEQEQYLEDASKKKHPLVWAFICSLFLAIVVLLGYWIIHKTVNPPKQAQEQQSKPTNEHDKEKAATQKPQITSPAKVPNQRVGSSIRKPSALPLSLQLLSESSKNYVNHTSEKAFEYSAFLENSQPLSSVKISVICIGYGLEDDASPRHADCTLSNFYLTPLARVPLKWDAYWSEAEEFMKEFNTDKCIFLLSVKFYNEKNELIERSRQLGVMSKGSYPLPVLHAGHILY